MQNTGECPPMAWYTRCSIPVTHECTVDVDCDKDEESENKCCYNGCSMTCQAAVEPKPGKPRQRKRSKAFDVFTNEQENKLNKLRKKNFLVARKFTALFKMCDLITYESKIQVVVSLGS